MRITRRWLHLVLMLSILVVHLPSHSAYAQDLRAAQVVASLRLFSRVLNQLALAPELQRPLPLSFVSPVHPEALRLSTIFTETLESLPAAPTSLDELGQALQAIQRRDVGGVNVTLGNVSVAPSSADPTLIDVAFDLDATHTIAVPMVIAQPPLVVTRGSYSADLQLATQLTLQVDTRAGTVAVMSPPVFNIAMRSLASPVSGIGRVGFADVALAGSLTLNTAAEAHIADPDRNGRITQDEWALTSPTDLFQVAYLDQPGDDVSATLALTAAPAGGTAISGLSGGSLTLNDPSLADGLAEPVAQLGTLGDFGNVTPSQVLSGLQSFTAALGSAHLQGDQRLPFGNTRLISPTAVIEPLVQFIHSQGDAALLCGAQDRSKDGAPPVGDPDMVAPGESVYCQAITLKQPTSVTWNLGGASTGNQDLATIGPNPTRVAQFLSASGGLPAISVTFTDDDKQSHTVYPLFRTAQELYTRLDAALTSPNPADKHQIEVGFDSLTSSLTYHLALERHPQPQPFDFAFGDTLSQSTGLFNLHSNPHANTQLAGTNLAVDATFGAIMVAKPDQIVPNGTNADRFFLKVRPGPGQYEISADTMLAGQIALDGQIGAVEVASAGPQQSVVIGRSDASTPMLAIDIAAPASGLTLQNGTSIPDAIRLTEFLSPTVMYIQPSLHVKLNADLHLEAKIFGPTLGSGDLHVEWPNVQSGAPNVAMRGAFADTLANFWRYSETNPRALNDAVTTSLDQLVQALGTAKSDRITAKLPVLGYSPKELLALDQLQQNLARVQAMSIGSLQQLAAELGNTVDFSLEPHKQLQALAGALQPATHDLVVHLHYSKADSTPLALRFYLGLNDKPTLIGNAGTDADPKFSYSAATNIRLGLPLAPGGGDSGGTAPYIFGDSNASVEAKLDTTPVSFGLGARSLQLHADGTVRFGAAVTLSPQSTPDQIFDIPRFIQKLNVQAGKAANFPAGDCGAIDGQPLDGDVCARLTLKLNDQSLPAELGFRIQDAATLFQPDDLSDKTGWYFASSGPDLGQLALDNPLNWDQLAGSLPELTRVLTSTLHAAQPVPLIGNELDAGAKIVDQINQRVVEPLSNLNAQLSECGDADAVKQAIAGRLNGQDAACGATQPPTPTAAASARVSAADDPIQITNVKVFTYCGGTNSCGQQESPSDITNIEVHLTIGGNKPVPVPFDLGVGGVPLKIDGALVSEAHWSLPLAFGLSRDEGPYFDHTAETLTLKLDTSLKLDSQAGPELPPNLPDALNGYTATRTVTGTLGFLQINLYDKDSEAERTQAGFSIALTTNAPMGHIPVDKIAGTLADLSPTGTDPSHLAINLLFRAHLADDAQGQIPAIIGTLSIPDLAAFKSLTPEKLFGNPLYIDAHGLRDSFLHPVLGTIEDVTRPIRPVIDTLYAPIPGISDISRMTTGKDITLASLVKTNLDSELLDRLASLAKFAADIDHCTESGIVEISSGVSFDKLCAPAAAQMLSAHPASATAASQLDGPAQGLTFPFLSDRATLLSMLLGKDVVLMRFDAGKLKGEGGFQQTYGPITVGPIPISIGVSASVSVEGRFAMGYDTVGLRAAASSGQPARLIDGLFLDDLDEHGIDVPEIAFGGTVAIAAAIDIGIAAAGIEGGVNLTLGLNLHEDDPKDGRIHFKEIGGKLQNPICLFDATGKLSAFLSAFVRIGFSFFSETFDFKIAEVTLVDFSQPLCANPPKPDLAEVYGNDLVLHMGPLAGLRHLDAGLDEKFTVRQISPVGAYPPEVGGSTRVSISAFGITEEENVPVNGRVLADAGDGNDTISLEPGVDLASRQPIPFTLSAWLAGGSGDDELKGALSDDVLCGDRPIAPQQELSPPHPCTLPDPLDTLIHKLSEEHPELVVNDQGNDGNDTLTSDAGTDQIYGGGKDDRIDGGLGDDMLYADTGNDVINGGPGADHIEGGADNDRLIGGPGTNVMANPSTGVVASDGVSPDRDDTIIGGDGNDYIEGGFGNDTLYGEEELPAPPDAERCGDTADPGAGQFNDTIQGGPDNDIIFGGPGDDHLAGQDGLDIVYGNTGDDTIDGEGEGTLIGAGNDILIGGAGSDTMNGQSGDDSLFGCAGDDHLYGEGGDDILSGGMDSDHIEGGAGRDYLFGDDGSAVRPLEPGGTTSVSWSEEIGDRDELFGGAGDDVLYGEGGNDSINGDAGQDTLFGNGGNDSMRGGADNDTMQGNADNDEMYGDSGEDRMFGNAGNDTTRGGTGDDYIEGNQGIDTMYGDANEDDLLGGSSTAGVPDDGDMLDGGGQPDYLTGDNAQIVRPGGVNSFDGSIIRVVTLLDIDSPDPTLSGGDQMFGGDGNDHMWGQAANDTMHGDADDDTMQGNAADDSMYGDAGQDDIVGGSDVSGRSDGADDIHGGDGQSDLAGDFDVIAGDNALIVRPLTFGAWRTNFYNGSIQRQVNLLDEAFVGGTENPSVSGSDSIDGESGDDLIYGQGGGDVLRGGSGDEYIEGNSGADTIYGSAGQDDIIGGTAAPGRVDAGDTIDGGDGQSDLANDHDVIAGDNAAIGRPLLCGQWQLNSFDSSIVRNVTLFEVASVGQTVVVRGNDQINGEGGDDRIYGQGGNDHINGGTGDDYIEGNADDDTIDGGLGNDDLVGGTGRINGDGPKGVDGRLDGRDTISGGPGFDTLAGDNAILARKLFDKKKTPTCPPNTAMGVPVVVGGRWRLNSYNAGVQHETRILLDSASANGSVTGSEDVISGDDDDDLLYGQNGNDVLSGGNGDDAIEGNAGSDTIAGEDGSDDLIGGTAQSGSIDDTPDFIRGGAGDDAIAGDNALITRQLDKNDNWKRDTNTDVVLRDIQLYDVQLKNKRIDPHFSSWDNLDGGAGYDTVLGQGGDDMLGGGDDPDYIEGNAGADMIQGGGGKDRLIGGGSDADGKVGSGKNLKDLVDGDDTIDGGGDGDIIIQGNGVIH